MTEFKNIPPLHLAAGTDELRTALHYIELNNSFATVTDAYILVRYNLSEFEFMEGLFKKYIHSLQWKMIYNYRKKIIDIKREGNILNVIVFDLIKTTLQFELQDEQDVKHPDYLKILPTTEPVSINTIALRQHLLGTLKKISGANRVGLILTFHGETKAIEVTTHDNYDFYAICMPVGNYGDNIDISKFKQP